MTDNEIIKALEEISHNENLKQYSGIPKTAEYALNLINRQEAEIERLNFVRTRDAQRYEQKISDQAHTNCVLYDLHHNAIKEVKELEEKLKTAKAEAYKEFAERVHCHCLSNINNPWNATVYPASWKDAYEQFDNEVDNLLTEMEGDNDEG